MYVNQFFCAILTVKYSTFFYDQKFVRDFPWKTFSLGCFILEPCVTHFNEAAYSKTYTTVKRLNEKSGRIP